MNKRVRVLGIVGAVLAVVAVLALAVPGLAEEPTETPTPQRKLWGRGFGGFCGGRGWNTFDGVSDALGLTPEGLFAELHSGKTIAEIAEAQGVEMDAIDDVVAAARKADFTTRIDELLEEGTISQEQADWMLEGMDKGYMGGRGFPGGGGFRGFGRR